MSTVSKRFINEFGNEIVLEVALGITPDRLCRLTLLGPDSGIENYTTRMELEQLRDALNEALK